MATEEDRLAAGLRNDHEEEEKVHISITFPPPTTAIAKEMHKVVMTEQRINTTQLFAFLTNADKDLSQLNALDNKPAACIINLPRLIRFERSIHLALEPAQLVEFRLWQTRFWPSREMRTR